MPRVTAPELFSPSVIGAAPRIGQFLRSSGYTLDAVREALSLEGELSSRQLDLVLYSRRLRGSQLRFL